MTTMHARSLRRRFVVALCGALAIGSLASFDDVAAQTRGGVFYACIKDPDHDGAGHPIRIVGTNERCKQRETRVMLNVTGEKGPQGDRGSAGPPGVTGAQGPRGDVGPQGPTGDTGPRGIAGLAGDTGKTGAPGARGPRGADGIGFTWRDTWDAAASYAPNDVVSHAGASWIAGLATRGSAPDARASGWSLVSASGEKGLKGATGDRGTPGAQGIQGERGIDGVRGPVGDRGDQGLPGLKGNQGDTGDKGAIGAAGPDGKLVEDTIVGTATQLKFVVPGMAQVLDQQAIFQNFGTGSVFCNLGCGQTFTAGVSGKLTAIGWFNTCFCHRHNYVLSIYAGPVPGGTPLFQGTFGGPFGQVWTYVGIPEASAPGLQKGMVYTFKITGDVHPGYAADGYAGGTAFTTQVGQGLVWSSIDMMFQTYVIPTEAGNLVIQNSGHVGVGTSAPKAGLDVSTGDVYVSKVGAAVVLKSPDGARCARLFVDNAGAFTRQPITCP